MQLHEIIQVFTQKHLTPSFFEGANYCYEKGKFKFIIHTPENTLWIIENSKTAVNYMVFCDFLANFELWDIAHFLQ